MLKPKSGEAGKYPQYEIQSKLVHQLLRIDKHLICKLKLLLTFQQYAQHSEQNL